MGKHRTDVGISGQPVPQSWFQSLMEYIGTIAANFVISQASTTSIQVVAGAGSAQVALGIEGKWRFISATANVSHPGGSAGTYDIYAVASANVFSGIGTGETDTTDYAFGLAIVAGGAAAPTGTFNGRAIAHTRKVGTLAWSGTAITDIQQTVGAGGLSPEQIASTIILQGTLASRPTASGANTGFLYFATDSNGGTLYRSNGATWTQVSYGLTSLPNAHASTHAPAGADALPWSTIHGYGTLASRPTAATTNVGYVYYSTDNTTLARSNGTSWDSLTAAPPSNTSIAAAILLSGTLASRPAAAAGNAGFYYFATDVNGGTLYQSTGSAWNTLLASAIATDAPKKLYQGQLAAVAATIYTVPTAKQTRYETLRLYNSDTVARTVTIYDGGTAAANTILPTTEIPAGDWIELDLSGMGGQATGTIAAVASAAAVVTATLYGSEEDVGQRLYKKLYQGTPGNALATVITAGARERISHIRAVNTHATSTLGLGLADGGTGAANTIQSSAAPSSQIPPGGVMEIQSYMALANAATLAAAAQGSGTDIVLTVYAIEG